MGIAGSVQGAMRLRGHDYTPHLVPRLGMNGIRLSLPLYVFEACTGTI